MIDVTDDRPRVLAWVRCRMTAGRRPDPQPQIIFTAPSRVGPPLEIAREYPVAPEHFGLQLDELAAKYSAPPVMALKDEVL